MNLRMFDSAGDLARAAARTLLQQQPSSVGLSGGSTPRRMYELLAPELPAGVTWVLVDERYVPRDHEQSNARMIETTLFASGLPDHWLPYCTELNDPAETADEFEREWRTRGLDRLDVVILGCGDDGHTASLFPGTPVLEVHDRIASEVYVPRLEQWRVTITMPVIRAAKLRIVLATGASKAPIVRDVRSGVPHPVTLATQGVETWWFVDRDAAALLGQDAGTRQR